MQYGTVSSTASRALTPPPPDQSLPEPSPLGGDGGRKVKQTVMKGGDGLLGPVQGKQQPFAGASLARKDGGGGGAAGGAGAGAGDGAKGNAPGGGHFKSVSLPHI